MDVTDLAIVAALVIAYGVLSGPLGRSLVTPPIAFVALGLVLGQHALGAVDLGFDEGFIRLLAEATLVIVLFTDAARIDLRVLRHEYALPARLLGVGLPLTIAAGTVAAWLLFDLAVWEAALLAAVLAPTDAALGHAVVTSESVPGRVRQGLNVESGLNDGIALPFVTLFIALAGVEAAGDAGFWTRFALEGIGFGLLVGAVVGSASALAIDQASRRGWMTRTQQHLATLAVAIAAFGTAEAVGGNGFIAAFAAGAAIGTVARSACTGLYRFAEEEGQLLTLVVFLVFGAAIVGPALGDLTWETGLFAILAVTVLRMLPVAIALAGTGFHGDTVAFLGWFGPRGLASILFGLVVVEESGLAIADGIFSIVAVTVTLSVIAHGVTARPLGSWYGRRLERMRAHRPILAEDGDATDHPARGG